jgi:hypothetical protein
MVRDYKEYHRQLSIAVLEIRKTLQRDYQSFSELIHDLELATNAARKIERDLR